MSESEIFSSLGVSTQSGGGHSRHSPTLLGAPLSGNEINKCHRLVSGSYVLSEEAREEMDEDGHFSR